MLIYCELEKSRKLLFRTAHNKILQNAPKEKDAKNSNPNGRSDRNRLRRKRGIPG